MYNAFWVGLLLFFVFVLELKDKMHVVKELIAERKNSKSVAAGRES
ncbi:MAG: hypothetical protein ABI638_03620 [Ignavibacteriota bacterium]